MILPDPHFLIWVLDPHLLSQRVNQSLLSQVQSERKRFDVQAKVAISEGVKKERIQSWTSSGKSENETEVTASVVRFDMIFLDFLKNWSTRKTRPGN